jgi:hypothetical protein
MILVGSFEDLLEFIGDIFLFQESYKKQRIIIEVETLYDLN